eukprot:m.561298 g.561298  ORF g.561298 m.561298 type:complete len:373 (+) comp22215_c0_seq10:335-1453(+)
MRVKVDIFYPGRTIIVTSCFVLVVILLCLLQYVAYQEKKAEINRGTGVYTPVCTHMISERNKSSSNSLPLAADGDKKAQTSKIPNSLWFTYKIDLWNRTDYDSWYPVQQRLSDNIHRTAAMHPSANVVFLSDSACDDAIKNLEPEFSAQDIEIIHRGFIQEKTGMMKGDLCRGAILFNEGGFYFDVDLYPVVDVRSALPVSTEFTSCYEPDTTDKIFQAFIGATPKHPIMYKYLEKFVEHYTRPTSKDAIGTSAMGAAVKEVTNPNVLQGVYMLQEGNLAHMATLIQRTPTRANIGIGCLGRDTPRIGGDSGISCNFIVYDPITLTVLMHSRVPGVSKMCYNKREHFVEGTSDNFSLKTIESENGIEVRFVA